MSKDTTNSYVTSEYAYTDHTLCKILCRGVFLEKNLLYVVVDYQSGSVN